MRRTITEPSRLNCDEPVIVCPRWDTQFRELARSMGHDPDNPWVGGYVQYEWGKSRWTFDRSFTDLAGRAVLEFGCNFGATAIVLATLGAEVEGVDVDADAVRLGELNVARYGCSDKVHLRYLPDTTDLPWSDCRFDAVVCNSVLEYVPRRLRRAVLSELDRVLRPGGVLFVLGTSNRLWPKEVHSHSYFINYIPDKLDWLANKNNPKGVWPFELTGGLRGYENLSYSDRGRSYIRAKEKGGAGMVKTYLLRLADALVRPIGITVGLLTPSISLTFRKPG